MFEKEENFITEDKIEDFELPDLIDLVKKEVMQRFETKKKEFDELGLMPFDFIERIVLLKVVNHFWMEHIDTMTNLKREIVSQGFGNQDPIIPYKKEGNAPPLIYNFFEFCGINLFIFVATLP